VVTHQLQVERRTAKAHRPKTDALPLDYATNKAHIAEISISGCSACGPSDVCNVGCSTESNGNLCAWVADDCELHAEGSDTDGENFVVEMSTDDGAQECEYEADTYCSLSDSDSDCASSDYDFGDENLHVELATWAAEFSVNSTALAALLKLLHRYHPSLPKSPRTISNTPRSVSVKATAGGSYHHFGIEKSLNLLHARGVLQPENSISIQINIDGLPLFKSTGMQLWPLLGLVKEPLISYVDPFVIGLFAGMAKPKNVAEFLLDFVIEAKRLQDEGFLISGKRVYLRFHSFVCDAPARSFLKNIKSFSGYHGCERCTQTGQYFSGRMTFPDTACTLRTDQGFLDMSDDEHHLSDVPSPLVELSLGMVSGFVLDYMHLICLGVVRRLLVLWLRGPLPIRLSATVIAEINNNMMALRHCIPCEFARKPRSLSDIDRWKATEFRQFLLFTGPVVMQNRIPEEFYKNFLLLHAAVTCLLTPDLCINYTDFAQKLLVKFVEHGCKLYGQEFAVYNVHSIIHVADDARRFGPLDNVSCFPFENFLRKLKKVVRKPSLPLQQVVNRLCERELLLSEHVNKPCSNFPQLKGVFETDFTVANCPGAVFYYSVATDTYTLRLKNSDNCVMLTDGKFGRVQYIFQHGAEVAVVVRLFNSVSSFYEYPLESKLVHAVCLQSLGNVHCTYSISDVQNKCLCIPLRNNSFFAVPMHK